MVLLHEHPHRSLARTAASESATLHWWRPRLPGPRRELARADELSSKTRALQSKSSAEFLGPVLFFFVFLFLSCVSIFLGGGFFLVASVIVSFP